MGSPEHKTQKKLSQPVESHRERSRRLVDEMIASLRKGPSLDEIGQAEDKKLFGHLRSPEKPEARGNRD